MDKPLDAILATVVSRAGDAIEITDEQARIIFVNEAFETMTGYRLTEIKGKTPAQFLRSEQQDQAIYDAMWTAIMARKHWSGQIIRRIKSGEHRPFEITVAPCMEHGKIKNIVAISRDVTEKLIEEKRKLELTEQVAYLQKMESLGRLAGRFAHDFNNLLTIINGNIDLALTEVGPPVSDYLQDAMKAVERAGDLTSQMLAYAGGGATAMKELALDKLIREVESLMRVPLPRNINLSFNLLGQQPAVFGDETQISQVLMNLINNAAEAIGEMHGHIAIPIDRIRLEEKQKGLISGNELEPGPYIRLVVGDDGPGIPKSIIPKIFEPFFSSKRGGHGLGLSSALGIIKSHRGDITVNSRQGQGTEFIILFPATSDIEQEKQVTSDKPGGKLALVVDDDELVRRVFSRGLELMEFDTIQARDGLEVTRPDQASHLAGVGGQDGRRRPLFDDTDAVDGVEPVRIEHQRTIPAQEQRLDEPSLILAEPGSEHHDIKA